MSRFGLVMSILLSLAIAVLCQPASSSSVSGILGRQKRGFRNSALSTARGFGKRMQPDNERILEDIGILGGERTREMPSSWLAEQMSRSPALAKSIVDKYLDLNGDGIISQEEMLQAF